MSTVTGTILVVDDEPLNRAILTRGLEREGHVVLSAADGEEALRVLADGGVDLVLLDVLMPGLDGLTVLERMKASAALVDIPVVMISSLDDGESVIRCIELGAEDFLPKPFDPVLLRARIRAGLARRRLAELERARVRDAFARFLPETVVDEALVRAGGDLRLGGTTAVGTLVFGDLRAFTTFSETRPADHVIEVLNRYYGEMTDAVLDHGGTLLSFLGDGWMAAFGAPIETDDHADLALETVAEILAVRLPRFNAWAGEQGLAPFRMGMGVSSGSFMSGTVGSARRLEYTAIGDTANTAARLEALTKDVPHPVLISDETTRSLRRTHDGLVFVDELAVRGRTATVPAWTLVLDG